MGKKRSKKIIYIGAAVLFLVIGFYAVKGMNQEMPQAEKNFLNSTLSKITAESSRADVVDILGDYSDNTGGKTTWWVNIDGNKERIVVYFSSKTEKATELRFDGGPGRFYYGEKLR